LPRTPYFLTPCFRVPNVTKIRLKRLLSKRKKTAIILQNLAEANNATFAIEDVEGKVLLGTASDDTPTKYPITCEGTVIGWVIGQEQAAPIADLIAHLAENEVEKNALADGTLEHYRELNLLYNLSEKLVASLEVDVVAQTALDEAGRLIKANGGCVILQAEGQERLNVVATFGSGIQLHEYFASREGLVGQLIENGQGEIINDIQADARSRDQKICAGVSSLTSMKLNSIGSLPAFASLRFPLACAMGTVFRLPPACWIPPVVEMNNVTSFSQRKAKTTCLQATYKSTYLTVILEVVNILLSF